MLPFISVYFSFYAGFLSICASNLSVVIHLFFSMSFFFFGLILLFPYSVTLSASLSISYINI